MKKILLILLSLCMISANVHATPEQRAEYAGMPGFVSAYTYEDGECFLDLASVSAEDYNPPRYQISATTYFITDHTSNISVRYMTFRYNYLKQTIFLKSMDGKWYWLNPDENPISMCQIQLADLLFQQCYQMPFIR